ncbi:MAG: antitoxin family protein [Chloroflexi bacterium]|nr:antitoxin family protein [Chloroflexota bacterium]
MPTKTIRALFSRGVIKPLERVNIPEGSEITVTIHDEAVAGKKPFAEALKTTAGGWKDLIDAEELKGDIYNDRLVRSRPEVRL